MNAADLADHLKQQSRQHYGSLALDWLRYLTQHSAQVRPVFQNVRQRFLTGLPPESDGQVRQRAGWIDTSGPQTLYLFYPTGWREATEGLSPDRAAKALMAAGYLVPDGNRPQRKVSLPDNTRPRLYCVKGSILDD
jgi:putative DNA primase/helicase